MNTFKLIRKQQKLVALFFLSIITASEAKAFTQKISASAAALGGPVAASASQYVNPFTGDFNYSVPLLTVPGPNGENVPITASYHAGIRMNQPASWLGLGWDFNPGEISRQVCGAPDDSNGGVTFSANINPHNAVINRNDNALYGPMYFNYSNQNTSPSFVLSNAYSYGNTVYHTRDSIYYSHDVDLTYQKKFALEWTGGTSPHNAYFNFAGANYDNYSISGAGLNGAIFPYVLGSALKWQKKNRSYLSTATTKPMQFYYARSTESDISGFDATTNMVKSGYYVRYYSNEELNGTLSSTNPFIDYQDVTGTRRPSDEFDPDGIGAFQVTTPDGITYHYSLPVYTDNEQYISFGLNKTPSGNLIVPDFNGIEADVYRKRSKYATSWKLTGVTGPDYVDNGNHFLDEGDLGYWIAYDYGKWNGTYNWVSDLYGYRKDFQIKAFSSYRSNSGWQTIHKYVQTGGIVSSTIEDYYLDKIRTATHTAFFVKSIRKDERSSDGVFSAGTPTPQLKLDRIILLRHEDEGFFDNPSASITSVSGYSIAGCNPANIIHDGKYNANATNINNASLKSVVFETDYSLCKKYWPNIANSITSSAINYDHTFGSGNLNDIFSQSNNRGLFICMDHPSSVLTSISDESNQGGKLTLNKIKVYELGKEQIYPSYDFSYTNNNPDFDSRQADIWGYYKSDYIADGKRRYYTTPSSQANVDAWSLSKITTPLGGEITVEYESDRYTHENGTGDDTEPYFVYLADDKQYYPVSASFTNEGDYQESITIKYRLVFPNSTTTSSCGGIFYEVTEWSNIDGLTKNKDREPFDYGYDQNCLAFDTYNPNTDDPSTHNNEWGWKKASVTEAYGGGIRVSKIKIKDPESGEQYEEDYSYENGVCTYKPDKFAVGSYSVTDDQLQNGRDNGPAMVGYGKVTLKSISNNGQDNGSIVNEYNTNFSLSNFSADVYYTSLQEGIWFGNDDVATFRCPCSGTQYTCTNNAYHKDYWINMSKNIGTFNGFGLPIKSSVYNKNGALLSYSLSKYKEVNSFHEEFGYDAQSTSDTITRFISGNSHYVSNIQTCDALNGYSSLVGHLHDVYSFHISSNTVYRKFFSLDKTESYSNGMVSTSVINERDPVSMMPLSSTVMDPTQGAITTTITPAYTNTVSYSSMGLKSACSTCEGNENLASLIEEKRVIKQPIFRDANGKLTYNSSSPGILLGASKQTYTKTINKRKYNPWTLSYENVSEAADTYLPYESYTALTTAATSSTVTPEWKKTNTATLFTTTNKVLETEGMTGRKSAVKYGYNNLYPLASISDANYNCFAFSSFEDKINVNPTGTEIWHFGGEVTHGEQQYPGDGKVKPHTGNYLAKVEATYGPGISFKGIEAGRTYRASVWVHKKSANNAALWAVLDGSVNGQPTTTWFTPVNKTNVNNISVGDWILMSLEFNVPEGYTEVNGPGGSNNVGVFVWSSTGTGYFDDLMVRPVDAPISGNVYDPKTARVIATLDNDDFASWFEYDAAGRVTATYVETREGVKKVSETKYNFAKPLN